MRRVAHAVFATLSLASATSAAADPAVVPSGEPRAASKTGEGMGRDEFESFPLVVRHDKHYLRATLEIGAVLVVGFVDYLLNTGARGGDLRQGDLRWDLRYDWRDLRGKLVGSAVELDANKFGTNYASHPFAGTLYFQVARSNHLSFAESFLFATLGSLTWDYFGEIREKLSVNDSIVTPSAGAAIGEATMQLSGFFRRGRSGFANQLLGFLFSPVKFLNDLTDSAEPERAARHDVLGFPTEPWHRFSIWVGAGGTAQAASGRRPRTVYEDVRLGAHFEVRNLPSYAGVGRHGRLFDDGNVASLGFDTTLSGGGELVAARFATRVVPVGYFFRDAVSGPDGLPYGRGGLIGMRAGFEYGVHDYDRDRARPRDLVSIVSPLGIAAEHVIDRGRLHVRTGLDVYGGMAGVQPYALSDFRSGVPALEGQGLPTAVENVGYYHAAAITVEPSAGITWAAFSLSAAARLDSFRTIDGLDHSVPGVAGRPRIDDQRGVLRGELGFSPSRTPLRVGVNGERSVRMGEIGSVHASRSETSFWGSVGLMF